MFDLDKDVKIIRRVGAGMYGTVYLVVYRGERRVMKIEKIMRDEMRESSGSRVWREIDFARRMGEEYPDRFSRLYAFGFVENCRHVQRRDPRVFAMLSPSYQRRLERLDESRYCLARVYEYRERMLDRELDRLTVQDVYSMIAQVVGLIELMQRVGFRHNDLHAGNIAVTRVARDRTVDVLGVAVPTRGRVYSAIDYGLVQNVEYAMSTRERHAVCDRDTVDMLFVYDILIDMTKFRRERGRIAKRNPEARNLTYMSYLRAVTRTPEYANVVSRITDNRHLRTTLFRVMYPDLDQRIILGPLYRKTVPYRVRVPMGVFIELVALWRYPLELVKRAVELSRA